MIGRAHGEFAYGGNEDQRIAALRQLAPALQKVVPIDFSFQLRPDKDWLGDIDTARLLASLSYEYGDPAIGADRLRHAADVARSHGGADELAGTISQLYEAEKARTTNAAQLSALRTMVRQATASLRTGYRSRAGRLWAAARADRLLGQMTRDELSEGTDLANAFTEIESLKARLLLDQLTLRPIPLHGANNIAAASTVERDLLGFPSCPHTHDELMTRELLLLSRMSLATEFTREEDERRVTQVENIYQADNAEFQDAASLPTLAAVQAALGPDQAIIEYFIPYYELHPAIDLWVAVLTSSRTKLLHVPLDRLLPNAGMIGSTAVDGCPPLDTSPLGNAVASLRVALQSTDEKRAGQFLRLFHQMLIEPIIEAGLTRHNSANGSSFRTDLCITCRLQP